ncbi:SAM-dependent methyltransferase [Actinocrispum wychmicini]|uniref:Cyclopropane fatty-acyl-phospholipid synthase-like methyltransferase n=1 Tax=Actinocrispum wychmicini TaxID=1213861 RepID=A0A4R2JL20_9PSEU|nr:class I SAM-dependent methyltransferase [Actinocrispum wychmicini]TCO59547.1 cyclopropane fatty-acyl-phospholipid synthase-like methyltransferase [Actinocrispum wychmicini]
MPLTTTRAELDRRFPIPPEIAPTLATSEQNKFAVEFTKVRDFVERRLYAEEDKGVTPSARGNAFLKAAIRSSLGKPLQDEDWFHETVARLLRRAWLSLSLGVYTKDISTCPDPAARLHLAQVNTVDLAWQPAVSQPSGGLIVEIGTGRGNSVLRLARLLPDTRIVSIGISRNQARTAEQLVTEMALPNVEIRCGDIYDPTVCADLVGQADAVGAIEVTGHFPAERKQEGIGILAGLLKPGGSLSLIDRAVIDSRRPLSEHSANQGIFLDNRAGYLTALSMSGLTPEAFIDYTADSLQTFIDTTKVLRRRRRELRAEFGWPLSLVWPAVPKYVHLPVSRQVQYAHIVGVKPA